MKFRKKPVVIDAEQYQGQIIAGVCEEDGHGIYGAHIHTLEGAFHVSLGDWVITGVKGERYPCKPDIFEATYELVIL